MLVNSFQTYYTFDSLEVVVVVVAVNCLLTIYSPFDIIGKVFPVLNTVYIHSISSTLFKCDRILWIRSAPDALFCDRKSTCVILKYWHWLRKPLLIVCEFIINVNDTRCSKYAADLKRCRYSNNHWTIHSLANYKYKWNGKISRWV